jgi:hypothetical protein
MKLPPPAWNASRMAKEASRSAVQPNTLPPRARGNTSRSLVPMRVMLRSKHSASPAFPRVVIAA